MEIPFFFLVHRRYECVKKVQTKWKKSHPSAKSGEQPLIVQGTEGMELLHGRYEGLHGGWVHEVEGQQVVYPHGFQWQYSAGKICPLNLWNIGGQHLVSIGTLCVQSICLTRSSPTSPACPLFSLSLLMKIIGLLLNYCPRCYGMNGHYFCPVFVCNYHRNKANNLIIIK